MSQIPQPKQRPFNRPPRILRELPVAEVELPTPPQLTPIPPFRWGMLLIPIITALVYFGVAIIRGNASLWFVIPTVAISFVAAAVAIGSYITQRKQYAIKTAEEYQNWHTNLKAKEELIIDLNNAQIAVYRANNPALISADQPKIESKSSQILVKEIVAQPAERLWERRSDDADFLVVRVGIGSKQTTTIIKQPNAQTTNNTIELLSSIAQTHTIIKHVPHTLNLPLYGAIGIIGPRIQTSATIFALIAHIIAHHTPNDVRIFGFWEEIDPKDGIDSWSWLKRLPHVHSLQGEQDYRLLAHYCPIKSEEELKKLDEAYHTKQKEDGKDLKNSNKLPSKHYRKKRREYEEVLGELGREIQQRSQNETFKGNIHLPYLIVILPYHTLALFEDPVFRQIINYGRKLGVSALCPVNQLKDVPSECGAYIDLASKEDNQQELATIGYQVAGGGRVKLKVDQINFEQVDKIASDLEKIPLSDINISSDIPRQIDLLKLLEIDDARNYDPNIHWGITPSIDEHHPSGLHPVPIGKNGPQPQDIVFLDLNEKKEGVHGMIAGTTGSGKSEFLMTLLISLAIKHSPKRLHLMLIDFKGGATFRDLATLPHTSGYITDLSGSQTERALLAINSELDKRKLFFGEKGVSNIREYREKQLTPEIPNLLIAIDEFDEMVNDHEEVVNELIRVVKQGRSLGVHLLFATQQPSNTKIKDGLKANLTYWLALRLVNADDSKTMLTNGDAAAIQNSMPGRGYKRVNRTITPFQSAIITLPYRSEQQQETIRSGRRDATGRIIYLESSPQQPIVPVEDSGSELSTAAVIIEQLQCAPAFPSMDNLTFAAASRPIWNPPFNSNLLLSELAPSTASVSLQMTLGKLDFPEEARQSPFQINLSEVGSVVALGSATSGKTAFLQTCILSIAQNYDPSTVVIYTINRTGDGLDLNGIPHLADSLSFNDTLKIERLFNLLSDEVHERGKLFRSQTWVSYHQALAANDHHALKPSSSQQAIDAQSKLGSMPAYIIVIDNLQGFLQVRPEDEIRELLTAKSLGIYLILTNDRLLKSSLDIGQKLVLRLNSLDDSINALNKRYAYELSLQDYGRGYLVQVPLPREFQIAYPTLNDPVTIRQSLQPANKGEPLPLNTLDRSSQLLQSVEIVKARWHNCEIPNYKLKVLDTSIDVDFDQWRDRKALSAVQYNETLVWPDPMIYLGRNNRFLEDIAIDFAKNRHMLIIGGSGTGKISLLQTVLAGWLYWYPKEDLDIYMIDYFDTEFKSLSQFTNIKFITSGEDFTEIFGTDSNKDTSDTFQNSMRKLQRQIKQDKSHTHRRKTIIAINKYERFDPKPNSTILPEWAKWAQDKRMNLHILITAPQNYSSDVLFKLFQLDRNAVVLGISPEPSSLLMGIHTAVKLPATMDNIPGRGFLIQRGLAQIVQFWQASDLLFNSILREHQHHEVPAIEPESPILDPSAELAEID
ncbi:FtsK/SpoIIIE domain-containing protein [Herpetosiphon llansteffanensis]